ncbi:hypothetical protein H7K45_14440 [Mycobacterium yunnanensis]|uniref:Uncharacterized protein n=1 Tax=Mycobacterium yunnanensis TaxID=368477 RepID=A0A9X2Z100_9MYCO|nr:hypothetical protein [Mycobacterium yunnanensis]
MDDAWDGIEHHLDVRAEAQHRHEERLTAVGFSASMHPGVATQYLRGMRDFTLDDYEAVPSGPGVTGEPSRRDAPVVGIGSSA